MMDCWEKIVFPVRKFCFAITSRIKARKNGAGLLKLHNDIQTCGYEDVQVMWEMLRKTESELMSKRKQRPFWRIFVWHNHSAASSIPISQA